MDKSLSFSYARQVAITDVSRVSEALVAESSFTVQCKINESANLTIGKH